MLSQASEYETEVRTDPERVRLREAHERRVRWYRWGPYLSERQWGTVREDYSADGDAWNYFTHDMARSRAYRWGEDGLLGICDEGGRLCFGLALWNEADSILKERLFGLSNGQGNHGEDVKEYYYFLDNTPTHSYMKALYKYPQRTFPYDELVRVNGQRSREEPEYELLDTGIFAEDRYFDVGIEYAKAGPEDIVIRIEATNRGPDAAPLHVLPTLWFRNTWSWDLDPRQPCLQLQASEHEPVVRVEHPELWTYWLTASGAPQMLFTENETDSELLKGVENATAFVKDAFHRSIVNRERQATNPAGIGTKAAAHYVLHLGSGESSVMTLRLTRGDAPSALDDAEEIVRRRKAEADAFYAPLVRGVGREEGIVFRQAMAGLLWSKQYYNYEVRVWLDGDPAQPHPPRERLYGRNSDWRTLNNNEVISMPDTWEYPWYAAWDLAFHCVSMALVDPGFAKKQLVLLTREWYMKPDGQIPAYEWSFGQANPPVQAWAALKVFRIERDATGHGDRAFLERVFHKLLVNFTWWVNRKDPEGHNVFEAGFLGLDNIAAFNRDQPVPTGGSLQQSDATAWMGAYSLHMLAIALELAVEDSVYEDIATKFFEHFMYIAGALNNVGGEGPGLWDEQDQFFYDVISLPDGSRLPLRIRSLVGLLPMIAVLIISPEHLDRLPNFRDRLEWFLDDRPDLAALVSSWTTPGHGDVHLVSLAHGERLEHLLHRMLDPEEFLSEHGIRSMSRFHLVHPYVLDAGGEHFEVRYDSGSSTSPMYGGNSNWRGPVWFPTNYLLIDALRGFHAYYGNDLLIEYPTGSGIRRPLNEIADDLARKLVAMYVPGPHGVPPAYRGNPVLWTAPHWSGNHLFFEFFDGDTARGLGASHQTGWTALVANLIEESRRRQPH